MAALLGRRMLKLHKPGGRQKCQPWFYLRLAQQGGGTMAWLGCPREHTVALETWRQRRTQPNPPGILTLEPEPGAPGLASFETWVKAQCGKTIGWETSTSAHPARSPSRGPLMVGVGAKATPPQEFDTSTRPRLTGFIPARARSPRSRTPRDLGHPGLKPSSQASSFGHD